MNNVPSNKQHANVIARIHVSAEAKRGKAFKFEAYAENEKEIGFYGSVTYRRVDRTVWNKNTLTQPVLILRVVKPTRHPNETEKKVLNNIQITECFLF